jgi:hypothetical protein
VKIYFDACSLSRLTDDQMEPRIREEAEAVERVYPSSPGVDGLDLK